MRINSLKIPFKSLEYLLLGVLCSTVGCIKNDAIVPKAQLTSNSRSAKSLASQWFVLLAGYQAPVGDSRLSSMTDAIASGLAALGNGDNAAAQTQFVAAEKIAMADPKYCDNTLRFFSELLVNQNSVHANLNDSVAMAMYYGCNSLRKAQNLPPMDFSKILYDDVMVIGDPNRVPAGTPAYAVTDNSQFSFLGNSQVFYGTYGASAPSLVATLMVQTPQYPNGNGGSAIPGSGILTTRAWGLSYLTAGTNRRPVYGITQLFHKTLQFDFFDSAVPDTYVLNMVSRAPGGDTTAYEHCKGCHAQMDASIPRAYAYYDFPNAQVVYKPGTVKGLVNKLLSENCPPGLTYPNPLCLGPGKVLDDSWVNYSNQHQNAALGWAGPQQGNGVPMLGRMIAQSTGFASGVVKYAYDTLGCSWKDSNGNDLAAIGQIANDFINSQYDLDVVFQESVLQCLGPSM